MIGREVRDGEEVGERTGEPFQCWTNGKEESGHWEKKMGQVLVRANARGDPKDTSQGA